MKTQTVIIGLAAMLFALPAGAQTSTPESLADESTNILKRYREHNAEWLEARRRMVGGEVAHAAVDLTTERAYLYAALCDGSKSSYRAKACEALFALILTDLGGGRNFGHIMSRKSIDKIHDIID